jgi:hypothetical protein
MAAVSADGSTVCVLIRRLNSSWRRSMAFDGVRGPGASQLRWRQAGEGEQGVACLFKAIGGGPVPEPPLADEGLAPLFDLLGRRGVDHVGVIGGDLLVQALGRVAEQVAILVNRAPLNGHAVPDCDDRLLQPCCAVYDQELRLGCWVHKTANVLNKVALSVQVNMRADLREIYRAPTRAAAEAAIDEFADKYSARYDKTVACLMKDRETLLAFFDFPAEH